MDVATSISTLLLNPIAVVPTLGRE